MLEFLAGKISERKLRLFAVACSRRIWPFLDQPARTAVEVAERFADGEADAEELRRARLACKFSGGQSSWYAAASDPAKAAANAARSAQAGPRLPSAEGAVQAQLLRDIAGNPFRPVSFGRPWQTPSVLGLARAIYAEHVWGRLPLLADALEQAGCDDADVLRHCRSGERHVRGCWAVDGLAGKA